MAGRGAVVVSLTGGVGNQLFQYAAGLTLSSERDVRLHVQPARTPAARELGAGDLVDLPSTTLAPVERLVCGFPGGVLGRAPSVLRRPVRSAAQRAVGYREVRQSLMQMADARTTFDPKARYLHLRGLFQHPTYYEPVLDTITASMARKLASPLDVASGDGTVAVHFRRGDYLLHGYDLPLSYQESALALVRERAEITRVVVMSDDPEFARLAAEHFGRRGFDAHALLPDPTRGELDDFCLFAGAAHLVMSNSTFVWWAAVLGDRLRPGGETSRVVVCPTPWMPMRAAGTIPSGSLDLHRPNWVLRSVCQQ
jgi:hypothetical protein